MRVLVTGSRDWSDETRIHSALVQVRINNLHEPITVVHGHCPTGADAIADKMCQGVVDVERHPAKWRPNGRLDLNAGFKRNAEMVNLGADLCLAFIKNGSKGATHTADLAEKAGIRTIRYLEP